MFGNNGSQPFLFCFITLKILHFCENDRMTNFLLYTI